MKYPLRPIDHALYQAMGPHMVMIPTTTYVVCKDHDYDKAVALMESKGYKLKQRRNRS